jgi:rSAM/selenodomain-associated transferase 2
MRMSPSPAVSVIIPTFNEEAAIAAVLESLGDDAATEVIVVDGGSGDRTVEIAARKARVIHAPAGRAAQMNAGAKAASADLLLFLHADVRLAPGALDRIRDAMRDPVVAGGNFDIRYEGGAPAAVFTLINRWRRRFGVFYGDSGIFCRRSVFQKLNGYQSWPIMEDYDFARRLSRLGKLALLDEPIRVSGRRWSNGGLFRTLWSWAAIQGLYSLGVSPHRLARIYRHIR